jgi:hypothetical protein
VRQAAGGKTHTPDGRQAKVERVMSVIDFFEYLAAHRQTSALAHELADIWTDHEVGARYEPAA